MIAGNLSGESIYTFSFGSGDTQFELGGPGNPLGVHLLSFMANLQGHEGVLQKQTDNLTPILLQADANGTHYENARMIEYEGMIAPELEIGVFDFNDFIITGVFNQEPLFSAVETVDFAYASASFTPAPTPLFKLQGGTSGAPIFLLDTPVAEVTGTISGFGSQEYYSFPWAGGAFNATGSILGVDPSASFSFSGGVAGNCNSIGSTALNSGNDFSSTILVDNLVPGQYCIGITDTGMNDPTYAITFNTPITNLLTPEPSGLVLFSVGLGIIGILSFEDCLYGARRAIRRVHFHK